MIDTGENIEKYTVSFLQEMKQEHEQTVKALLDIRNQVPKKVMVLKSMIHGQRPSITDKEEADALFPFYPKDERIVIDVCDMDDLEMAKRCIKSKVEKYILNYDGSDIYAAFIMAQIPLGCYLGYLIGNKIPVQSFQHFRDTEDWKWREGGGTYVVQYPEIAQFGKNVKLFVNISGVIEEKLTGSDFPIYKIAAESPGFSVLQSWEQVVEFRSVYRNMLDRIRKDHGEDVIIHLFVATPNPINFEIGKGIMKNIDPTIVLYDKINNDMQYKEIMHLHDRVR